jgi:SAM-dependent methyltransferase
MTEWRADAADYARDAAFVPALGGAVLDLLDPRPGERVLDLGCGDGALTVDLAARGAAVVGVDVDASMVAAVRERGIDARLGDGQSFTAAVADATPFDAVFSNAALHWMPDAAAVLRQIRTVLRPGGRFVAEFGGFGNVAAIRSAARGVLAPLGLDAPAWFFPRPEAYAELLAAEGFTVASCDLIHRPTPLPAGMAAWLTTFLAAPLATLDPTERTDVIAAVTDLLEPSLRDEQGGWWADYVRLRVAATRD